MPEVSTAFYFAWFLIIVPFIGFAENTLLDVATTRRSLQKHEAKA